MITVIQCSKIRTLRYSGATTMIGTENKQEMFYSEFIDKSIQQQTVLFIVMLLLLFLFL